MRKHIKDLYHQKMKKEDINTVENEEQQNNEAVQNDVNNEAEVIGTEDTSANENTDEAPVEAEEKDPLEAAKEEIEELKKTLLYKQAEFENYRKRTIKEKADLVLAGGEKTVKDILPVLDDFERAIADKSDDPVAIKEGMNLIYSKFIKILEGMGVKKIDTTDADFNVDYHESIALVPGMGDDKKGKVIDCVQTGYTLNDKVIRYAKVAVGQ